MGQIYAVYELFPESTDVDLQGVIAKVPQVIPAAVKFNDADTKIAPVAFGLEKVVVAFIIDDSDETAGRMRSGTSRASTTSSALRTPFSERQTTNRRRRRLDPFLLFGLHFEIISYQQIIQSRKMSEHKTFDGVPIT